MGLNLRLLASLSFVGASYLLGQALSRRTLTRLDDLYALAQALTILATEIGYAATPLPEALRRAARAAGGHVEDVLGAVARTLDCGATSVEQAWHGALTDGTHTLGMAPEDLRFAAELGPTLGRSDREDQVAHLSRVARQLETQAARLAPECEKSARLSRTLGLLGGLAAAILVL